MKKGKTEGERETEETEWKYGQYVCAHCAQKWNLARTISWHWCIYGIVTIQNNGVKIKDGDGHSQRKNQMRNEWDRGRDRDREKRPINSVKNEEIQYPGTIQFNRMHQRKNDEKKRWHEKTRNNNDNNKRTERIKTVRFGVCKLIYR